MWLAEVKWTYAHILTLDVQTLYYQMSNKRNYSSTLFICLSMCICAYMPSYRIARMIWMTISYVIAKNFACACQFLFNIENYREYEWIDFNRKMPFGSISTCVSILFNSKSKARKKSNSIFFLFLNFVGFWVCVIVSLRPRF